MLVKTAVPSPEFEKLDLGLFVKVMNGLIGAVVVEFLFPFRVADSCR